MKKASSSYQQLKLQKTHASSLLKVTNITFYTNDLASTPSEQILHDDSYEAIKTERGPEKLFRQTRDQSVPRKAFLVPNLSIACNALMGGKGRIDQVRTSHSRLRRERKLSLIFFLFCLDLCAHNEFCFREMIAKGKSQSKISVREFKRRFCLSCVSGKKPCSEELEIAKKTQM